MDLRIRCCVRAMLAWGNIENGGHPMELTSCSKVLEKFSVDLLCLAPSP